MGSMGNAWAFYFPLYGYVSLPELFETWLIQFRGYILNFKVVLVFDNLPQKIVKFTSFSCFFIAYYLKMVYNKEISVAALIW